MVTSPAIFASAFHPHVGGVEELTRQLAAEQRRRGATPVVVTNRYPKTLAESEVHEGIDVLRFPFRVPEPNLRQYVGWLLLNGLTRRQIRARLRARGTDLVHVQCVSSNGRYALAASRELGLPLVVTMQGELTMDATGVYQRSAQLRATWRELLDRADVITGCSRYVLEEAEAAYGRGFGERARVVYNGIRQDEFADVPAAQTDRPFVLGIGRMVPQKGFDLLVEAFAKVSSAHPDVELVLAGDGSAREGLQAQSAASAASSRIRFVGSVAHRDAVALFKAARVFVLPSRHEPQGIVVLEAMAGGAAVLAAAVGGVPEVVDDGHNGLTFPGSDAIALADRLDHLLGDEALRTRLVSNGTATAARFDWPRIVDDYEACYARAIA